LGGLLLYSSQPRGRTIDEALACEERNRLVSSSEVFPILAFSFQGFGFQSPLELIHIHRKIIKIKCSLLKIGIGESLKKRLKEK